jgi:hypothetical protein
LSRGPGVPPASDVEVSNGLEGDLGGCL